MPAGAVAGERVAGGLAGLRVEVHVAGGGAGGALAEVDEGGVAVGEADEHEAAASDIAGGGVRDGEREGDGDGGVDGIAAGFEDGLTGVGGVGFARDDHAVARVDRLARGEFGGEEGEGHEEGRHGESGGGAGSHRSDCMGCSAGTLFLRPAGAAPKGRNEANLGLMRHVVK